MQHRQCRERLCMGRKTSTRTHKKGNPEARVWSRPSQNQSGIQFATSLRSAWTCAKSKPWQTPAFVLREAGWRTFPPCTHLTTPRYLAACSAVNTVCRCRRRPRQAPLQYGQKRVYRYLHAQPLRPSHSIKRGGRRMAKGRSRDRSRDGEKTETVRKGEAQVARGKTHAQ